MPKTGMFVFGQHVEEHRLRRVDGVVVAAFVRAKISWRSGERASDNAPDAMGAVE